MAPRGEKNVGLTLAAAGAGIMGASVVFGLTTESGAADWIGIVTATAGFIMVMTGLFRAVQAHLAPAEPGRWEHGAMSSATSKPSYVVLRQVGKHRWQVVGEVERKPGLTARNARARAIEDATGGKVRAGQVYRVILSSERRIAAD
jgi:hypothetical protein